MSESYSRAAEIGEINSETGEFPVTIATEGEAQDGHILSIRGLELGDEIPFQIDHSPGALANLGTVRSFTRDRKEGIHRARGIVSIRLTGDGDHLAARRDLVDGIAKRAIKSVSLTWDIDDVAPIERTALPKSHPAFVARSEKNFRRRYGLFFPKSRGVELSLVGVGKDASALFGRAENAPNDISREMWKTLANQSDDAESGRASEIIEALESRMADLETRLGEAAEPASESTSQPLPEIKAFLSAFSRELTSERLSADRELVESLGEVFADLTGRDYPHAREQRSQHSGNDRN